MKTLTINSLNLAKIIADVFHSDIKFTISKGHHSYYAENTAEMIGWLMLSLMKESKDLLLFDTNNIGFEFFNDGTRSFYANFTDEQRQVIEKYSLVDSI